MEIHIKIVGVLLVALAVMHVGIPNYFKWKQELQPLTLITRQILYVHTFFIAFVVLLIGLLCLGYSHDLVSTSLGRIVCMGLAVFWLTRLIFQFFVYSSKVWKGKIFETIMHILFSLLWLYFSSVFVLACIYELR